MNNLELVGSSGVVRKSRGIKDRVEIQLENTWELKCKNGNFGVKLTTACGH